MNNSFLTDYLTFTEWWHYALLVLWMILLFLLTRYFSKIESLFQKKDFEYDGTRSGKSMLIVSFSTGLTMVIIWMFKPVNISELAELNWQYIELAFYGLFFLLLIINGIVSVMNYSSKSGIIRLVVLTLLMIIYFYTGMFGGLLVLSVFVLIVIIYFLIKFKNILKIG